MATVLQECAIEEQRSVMRFLWSKGLNAKDIHKEMFAVYGGKCSSCKAFHNWVEKHVRIFADDEVVATGLRKWLRQKSETFMLRDSMQW
jgi:hypothetical protein